MKSLENYILTSSCLQAHKIATLLFNKWNCGGEASLLKGKQIRS